MLIQSIGHSFLTRALILLLPGHRNVEYPMLFEIRNLTIGKASHCGVMEFTAEEGKCYMPYWMMNNLVLQEGSINFKFVPKSINY